MELAISLGLGGWALLIVGAAVLGFAAVFVGDPARYEWLANAIGATAGGVVASEFIVALRTFGPVWDGLAFVPALIGGVVVVAVVALVARSVVGGAHSSRPMAA